jgi:hypothetical protein
MSFGFHKMQGILLGEWLLASQGGLYSMGTGHKATNQGIFSLLQALPALKNATVQSTITSYNTFYESCAQSS